jgi:hypothetical protein
MHVSPRPGGAGAIRKVVLHLNAGPEQENGATSLAQYLKTIEGGYHEICDDKAFVVCAQPDQLVYGAAGMNEAGYHICLVGNLQSAAQWHDAYSTGEMHIAAARVADACHRFGIPAIQLTDAQVADPNVRGVCDHWAVNRAIQHGDHVDVGPGFPWAEFMGLVNGMAPTPPPSSEDIMRVLIPAPVQPDPNQWRGAVVDVGARTMIALGGAVIKPGLDPVEAASPWQGVDVDDRGLGKFTIVADTPDARNNAPYRHTVS